MNKRILLGVLGTVTLLVGWLALPYHPLYQEWICRDASREKLESLRSRLPDNPSLFYYLGLRLSEARRLEEAISCLQRALLLDPDSARIRDALAAVMISSGQTRPAYACLQEFYRNHPNDPDAYRMLGRFFLTTATFSEAIRVLTDATQKYPTNSECWALLAIAHRQSRNLPAAEAAVAHAVHLAPGESKYWFLQAQILKNDRKDSARSSYERAVTLAPNDHALLADFADYLARAGDDPAAERYARRALEQNPDDLRASGALGIVLGHRNDPNARPYLLKGLQNDRHDVLLIRSLQKLAASQGNKTEAEQWLQAVVRAQRRLQKEQDLNTLLERNPRDVQAIRQMALLAAQDGDYFRSMHCHAQLLQQVVDAPGVLLATANDLKQEGHSDLAQRLAQQALQNSKTPQEKVDARTFMERLTAVGGTARALLP